MSNTQATKLTEIIVAVAFYTTDALVATHYWMTIAKRYRSPLQARIAAKIVSAVHAQAGPQPVAI
jgi:hypothetical protein